MRCTSARSGRDRSSRSDSAATRTRLGSPGRAVNCGPKRTPSTAENRYFSTVCEPMTLCCHDDRFGTALAATTHAGRRPRRRTVSSRVPPVGQPGRARAGRQTPPLPRSWRPRPGGCRPRSAGRFGRLLRRRVRGPPDRRGAARRVRRWTSGNSADQRGTASDAASPDRGARHAARQRWPVLVVPV